jgi:hypothetical protein
MATLADKGPAMAVLQDEHSAATSTQESSQPAADVEKQCLPPATTTTSRSVTSDPENNILPTHLDPQQWSPRRKVLTGILISLSQLVSLMSASVIAPALPKISRVLHIDPSTTQITMSIYLLGFAVGPLIIAPWSEAYGRRPLWLGSQLFYIFWNTLCPVGDQLGLIVVGRFLSGVGGSGGPIVSICDLFLFSLRSLSLMARDMF